MSIGCTTAEPITTQAQHTTGPGSNQYKHELVIKSSYGNGTKQYWIFEPAEPKPAEAPLIIFMHGWGQMNPVAYGGWVDHLVRRGNIVIYPRYQDSMLSSPAAFVPDSTLVIHDGIARLQEPGRVRPRLDQTSIVGHSCGGLLAVNLAATAAESGLPIPLAVMSVQPGRSPLFGMADLSKIAPDTRLMLVVGEEDLLVSDIDAKLIFQKTPHLPPALKQYVLIQTDDYGKKPLKAGHLAPMALHKGYDSTIIPRNRPQTIDQARTSTGFAFAPWLKPMDAMDYGSFWLLFDTMHQAALTGRTTQDAIEHASRVAESLKWSDGTQLNLWQAVSDPQELQAPSERETADAASGMPDGPHDLDG